MDEQNIKKILYIKNYNKGKNLEYLKKFFPNTNINYIISTKLIKYTIDDLIKIIDPYDIIILGGGEQHLTSNNFLITYPEIQNQIEIVKLISTYYYKSKLVIGICLGCQIIALSFGFKINQMKKLIIGFDYMDTKTINYNYINNSGDKYLDKFDYNLLSKSFSFHYDCIDCIDFNDNCSELKNSPSDKLILIAQSIEKHPYIISNTNLNIYGFQFHPEICIESIFCVIDLFLYTNTNTNTNTTKFNYLKNSSKLNEIENIYKHFFDIFIKKNNIK